MIALAHMASLADVADPWRLGIPQSNARTAFDEDDGNGPVMVHTMDEPAVAYFPATKFAEGFKLVRDRIWRFGGSFGTPRGPSLDHPRIRTPERNTAAGPGAKSMSVRSMPAGLTPTAPWWESHLYGSDGYLAT